MVSTCDYHIPVCVNRKVKVARLYCSVALEDVHRKMCVTI